jgi:hypothetical protein
MMLVLGLGMRRSLAWNSPHRRRSAENVKPARACTLPLAAIRLDRASASQVAPRSIAAHAPAA